METPAASPRATTASPDGVRLLLQTAEIGEYFALTGADRGDWRAIPALFDEATLIDFVERTRTAIAASARCDRDDISVRMAASSFQLGVAARLLSPPIGAASCFGAVPVINERSLVWQPTSSHRPEFAGTDLDWVRVSTPERAAELIASSICDGVLRVLNDKLRDLMSLSSQVSWGNVISAANGAVTVLAMSRPERERAGRDVVRALLNTEPLRGTGEFSHGRFQRRSCCLFYQAPGSGLCGDCVLTVSGGSH